MKRVLINGRWRDLPEATTDTAIRETGAVPAERNLMRRGSDGVYTLIPRGTMLAAREGDEFFDAPRRVKGAGALLPFILESRAERVAKEVFLIAPDFARFAGVNHDEHGDWIHVPYYPLPERWAKAFCQLLVLLPDTYPVTPPLGFYLNQHLTLSSGGEDPHYVHRGFYGAPDLRTIRWYWYCLHTRKGGWRSSTNYRQPDNLQSFMSLVHDALANDN